MFTAVICGRPNVGKSTLFNRLSGTKKAITYPVAGTTRDVLETECLWQNKKFLLIDTGGIEIKTKEKLEQEIQKQIDLAIGRADLVLFLSDGKQGVDQNDFVIASKIRRLGKPYLAVVNKIDSKNQEEGIFPFYKLGLDTPLAISAQTGKGCGDLLDKIVLEIEKFPKQPQASRGVPQEEKPIKVGIFGRQNVGKSSLLNSLLGKTKTIVSEIPGTTRDAIDTLISYQDQKIILIDTAGIKRKKKIELGVEKFSMKKSLTMIEKCDIALLVLDAKEGISRQDWRIGAQISKNKKGFIILFNKWDLIREKLADKPRTTLHKYENEYPKNLNYGKSATGGKKEIEKIAKQFQLQLESFSWAPIIFISAKSGENIKIIFDLILEVNKGRNKLLTEKEQEDFFNSVILKSPPPKEKLRKKHPKVKKFLQEDIRPPKFSLIIGQKEVIPPFYFRFLEKQLRQRFGFFGTPIEITTRSL